MIAALGIIQGYSENTTLVDAGNAVVRLRFPCSQDSRQNVAGGREWEISCPRPITFFDNLVKARVAS